MFFLSSMSQVGEQLLQLNVLEEDPSQFVCVLLCEMGSRHIMWIVSRGDGTCGFACKCQINCQACCSGPFSFQVEVGCGRVPKLFGMELSLMYSHEFPLIILPVRCPCKHM